MPVAPFVDSDGQVVTEDRRSISDRRTENEDSKQANRKVRRKNR